MSFLQRIKLEAYSRIHERRALEDMRRLGMTGTQVKYLSQQENIRELFIDFYSSDPIILSTVSNRAMLLSPNEKVVFRYMAAIIARNIPKVMH